MEQTRESISQAVEEIKGTVSDQVVSVKKSVSDTFDWREQFRRRPVAWSVGVATVGAFLGYSLAENYKDTDTFKAFQAEVRDIEDQIAAQFSDNGSDLIDGFINLKQRVIVPTIVGLIIPGITAAAIPFFAEQIRQATGIDLSNFTAGLPADSGERRRDRTQKNRKKRAAGGKKKRDR